MKKKGRAVFFCFQIFCFKSSFVFSLSLFYAERSAWRGPEEKVPSTYSTDDVDKRSDEVVCQCKESVQIEVPLAH